MHSGLLIKNWLKTSLYLLLMMFLQLEQPCQSVLKFSKNQGPINPPQTENGDEQLSFQQAVDRMKQAFLDKWEWMDKNIGNLR